MPGYTYNTLFTALCNQLAIISSVTPPFGSSATLDGNWGVELPFTIGNAEQRIYRELDLMTMRVTDASTNVVSGQRNFTLPTTFGTFTTVEYVNVFTPAMAVASAGTRNPLLPVGRAVVDSDWPSGSTYTGLPKEFAQIDTGRLVLGPTPNQNYPVEVIGTQRPAPLSSANQNTWLASNLPDLFFAGCMVNAACYMQAFQQSDNPQNPTYWEGRYMTLLKSADSEESRKFFRSAGWTAQAPRAVTTPPRV